MRGIMRIVLILLFICTYARAEIYEAAHFEEILSYIQPTTLVVLDIDDTLLMPAQTLGSDVWLIHRANQHKNHGMPPKEAFDEAIAEWEAIRHLTKVRLVEEGADRIIQKLQEKGVAIMGVTLQALTLAIRTAQQLKSLNIDLSLTAPTSEDLYFFQGNGILFRKGILFTAGHPKGKSLHYFFQETEYHPDLIVSIDDRVSHLKNLELMCEEEGIPFIGLRYSYCDKRNASFNPQIADLQFAPFLKILSDEEATALLIN